MDMSAIASTMMMTATVASATVSAAAVTVPAALTTGAAVGEGIRLAHRRLVAGAVVGLLRVHALG